MSVRDILGRLLGEPSTASVWAGTPRFRCCDACSVELFTFGEIREHRRRCRTFFLFSDELESGYRPDAVDMDAVDAAHNARHLGCVCQSGASDEYGG